MAHWDFDKLERAAADPQSELQKVAEKLFETFLSEVEDYVEPVVEELNHYRKRYTHFEESMLVGVNYGLEYKDDNPFCQLWYFTVELIGGPVHEEDLHQIWHSLSYFGHSNQLPVQVGDLSYTIGDGDDSYAVFFQNGKFNIWLRGWKDNG